MESSDTVETAGEQRPWGRYAELRPDQLAAIVAAAPIAYVPWGALEWHGPHLPFGLDGITAEGVAERAARQFLDGGEGPLSPSRFLAAGAAR